ARDTMSSSQMTPSVDDHVFLLGRPPISEFLGFIRNMAVGGQNADQGLLTQEWRRANDHVVALEQSEAGIADNPTVTQLPLATRQLADSVVADPLFRKAFQ